MSNCSTIKQGKIDQNIMLLVSYELIFYYLSYFFEFIIFWFQVFKCIAKICFSLISWHKWNWIFFWNKIESDPKNPSVKVSSHVLLVISCSIAKIFVLKCIFRQLDRNYNKGTFTNPIFAWVFKKHS